MSLRTIDLKRQRVSDSFSHIHIHQKANIKEINNKFYCNSKHKYHNVISYLTSVKPKDISHDIPNPKTTNVISYLTSVKPKDISHDIPNPKTTSIM